MNINLVKVRRMPDRRQRLEEHRNRNCLFCQIQEHLKDTEAYRNLNVGQSDVCFAILDRNPKALGHCLVIAKAPFNDFTDNLTDIEESEKTTVFKEAIELSRKLKEVLKAEKVYIMSMCEHWQMWETSDGVTTEHLHFHLVPRYDGMRNKFDAAERLLARDGKEQTKEALQNTAKLLNEHK